MPIVNTIGFQYYRPLRNTTYSNFNGLGDLDFVANNLNGGYSRFTFSEINNRMWLTARPGSGSRAEVEYWDPSCYSYGYRDILSRGSGSSISYSLYRRTNTSYRDGGYWKSRYKKSGRYSWENDPWDYNYYRGRYYVSRRERYCRASGRWLTDWSETYENREIDSSRRTPSYQLSVNTLFKSGQQHNGRYLYFGFRMYFPNLNNIPVRPATVQQYSGDRQLNDYFRFYLLTKSEVSTLNVNEIYVECKIDTVANIMYRWFNDEEVDPVILNVSDVNNFKSAYIHFGSKSTSRSSGAPSNNEFSLNDIVSAVSDTRNDPEFGDRIGPVEVDMVPVSLFELNRHWNPPLALSSTTNEPTEETVNRVKTSDSVSDGLIGDTHSDPATVRFATPAVGDDEEIIYANVKVWGSQHPEGTASKLIVNASSGLYPVKKETAINVRRNTFYTYPGNSNSVYDVSINPTVEEDIMANLELKITFEA